MAFAPLVQLPSGSSRMTDGIIKLKEMVSMTVLLILALGIGGYLVYALVHPERF